MQERRVTLDGRTHPLSPRFMVVATQNPLEQQGTYPLPEAQLDRFLFKQVLAYPSREEERKIVATYGMHAGSADPQDLDVGPVAEAAEIAEAAQAVAEVRLTDDIVNYVLDLVRSTRETADLQSGASPRAASQLALAARARAALDGRDYALPDDVKALALPLLRHRVILSPAAEIDGRRAETIISALVDRAAAPR
jgi:MoxR-like ATPase